MSILNNRRTRMVFASATVIAFVTGILPGAAFVNVAMAGMPSLLPSNWTAKNTPSYSRSTDSLSDNATALRIQGVSFFAVMFLLSAWLIKCLWNTARRDFPQLPIVNYGRSLSLLILWGLAFIVVLTMISGARELMTPGAWKKQGWTYKLSDSEQIEAVSGRAARQRSLQQLRTALWLFAATHGGKLPDSDEASIDLNLWQIPGWPGLKFIAIRDRKAETNGQLYVFEPDAHGDERIVLLTNGFIGTMRSAEIKQALSVVRAEADSTSLVDNVDGQPIAQEERP